MTYVRLLILTTMLLAMPTYANSNDVAQRAQRVNTISEQSPRPADLEFAENVRRAYADNFGRIDDARHLHDETDADLKLHWDAVSTAAFYATNTTLLDAALRIYAEMQRRSLMDDRGSTRLFDYLLKARRFDAARKFAAAHPALGLPAVPQFIDTKATQPSVWQFDVDGRAARRIGLDLAPLQIIVAAGCHFSEDAASDISKDPVLGPIFAKHARWLSLAPGAEKLDALADWNRSHPRTPMLAIHDRREWALISKWMMPTFAIIKDGKLIDSVHGWDSEDPEFRQQLIALLQRAGLLAADTSSQ